MGVQEELKQFIETMLAHSDKIERLDLNIRMKNGNRMMYKIDRKLEAKLEEKEQKRIAKIEIEEKKRKIKEELRQKKEELKKQKI